MVSGSRSVASRSTGRSVASRSGGRSVASRKSVASKSKSVAFKEKTPTPQAVSSKSIKTTSPPIQSRNDDTSASSPDDSSSMPIECTSFDIEARELNTANIRSFRHRRRRDPMIEDFMVSLFGANSWEIHSFDEDSWAGHQGCAACLGLLGDDESPPPPPSYVKVSQVNSTQSVGTLGSRKATSSRTGTRAGYVKSVGSPQDETSSIVSRRSRASAPVSSDGLYDATNEKVIVFGKEEVDDDDDDDDEIQMDDEMRQDCELSSRKSHRSHRSTTTSRRSHHSISSQKSHHSNASRKSHRSVVSRKSHRTIASQRSKYSTASRGSHRSKWSGSQASRRLSSGGIGSKLRRKLGLRNRFVQTTPECLNDSPSFASQGRMNQKGRKLSKFLKLRHRKQESMSYSGSSYIDSTGTDEYNSVTTSVHSRESAVDSSPEETASDSIVESSEQSLSSASNVTTSERIEICLKQEDECASMEDDADESSDENTTHSQTSEPESFSLESCSEVSRQGSEVEMKLLAPVSEEASLDEMEKQVQVPSSPVATQTSDEHIMSTSCSGSHSSHSPDEATAPTICDSTPSSEDVGADDKIFQQIPMSQWETQLKDSGTKASMASEEHITTSSNMSPKRKSIKRLLSLRSIRQLSNPLRNGTTERSKRNLIGPLELGGGDGSTDNDEVPNQHLTSSSDLPMSTKVGVMSKEERNGVDVSLGSSPCSLLPMPTEVAQMSTEIASLCQQSQLQVPVTMQRALSDFAGPFAAGTPVFLLAREKAEDVLLRLSTSLGKPVQLKAITLPTIKKPSVSSIMESARSTVLYSSDDKAVTRALKSLVNPVHRKPLSLRRVKKKPPENTEDEPTRGRVEEVVVIVANSLQKPVKAEPLTFSSRKRESAVASTAAAISARSSVESSAAHARSRILITTDDKVVARAMKSLVTPLHVNPIVTQRPSRSPRNVTPRVERPLVKSLKTPVQAKPISFAAVGKSVGSRINDKAAFKAVKSLGKPLEVKPLSLSGKKKLSSSAGNDVSSTVCTELDSSDGEGTVVLMDAGAHEIEVVHREIPEPCSDSASGSRKALDVNLERTDLVSMSIKSDSMRSHGEAENGSEEGSDADHVSTTCRDTNLFDEDLHVLTEATSEKGKDGPQHKPQVACPESSTVECRDESSEAQPLEDNPARETLRADSICLCEEKEESCKTGRNESTLKSASIDLEPLGEEPHVLLEPTSREVDLAEPLKHDSARETFKRGSVHLRTENEDGSNTDGNDGTSTSACMHLELVGAKPHVIMEATSHEFEVVRQGLSGSNSESATSPLHPDSSTAGDIEITLTSACTDLESVGEGQHVLMEATSREIEVLRHGLSGSYSESATGPVQVTPSNVGSKDGIDGDESDMIDNALARSGSVFGRIGSSFSSAFNSSKREKQSANTGSISSSVSFMKSDSGLKMKRVASMPADPYRRTDHAIGLTKSSNGGFPTSQTYSYNQSFDSTRTPLRVGEYRNGAVIDETVSTGSFF